MNYMANKHGFPSTELYSGWELWARGISCVANDLARQKADQDLLDKTEPVKWIGAYTTCWMDVCCIASSLTLVWEIVYQMTVNRSSWACKPLVRPLNVNCGIGWPVVICYSYRAYNIRIVLDHPICDSRAIPRRKSARGNTPQLEELGALSPL